MEKIVTKQNLKEQEQLTNGIINDFLKPVKLAYNTHNKYRPVKLYDLDKVLTKIQETPIKARMEFVRKWHDKNSKRSLKINADIRAKSEKLLNELINQIQIIELPEDTIKINAILSVSNFTFPNAYQYVKSLLPRIDNNSISTLVNNYIVHNLIHFSSMYSRVHGDYRKFCGLFRQRYVDAIIDKATYVYPDCKEALIGYLTLINRFKFTSFNLKQLQRRWDRICNPDKPITFYDELDTEYQNICAINVKDI